MILHTLQIALTSLVALFGLHFGGPLFGATPLLTESQGGTGSSTAPISQVIYGGAGGHYQSTPTTTASCSGSASCSSFTVLGNTPVTISASGSGGSSFAWPFTVTSYGAATSTAIGLLNGFTAPASSTISGPFHLASNDGGLALNGGLVYSGATTTFNSPLNYSNGAVTLSTAGTWSGNAVTATALAANGTNCSAGNYPLGVDASGNAENCTTSAAAAAFPFTAFSWGNATTSVIDFTQGIIVNASTTFAHLGAGGAAFDPTGRIYSAATTTFTGTSPVSLTYLSGQVTGSIANAVADGSTKGAASFTSNDFNDGSGNISLDYTNGQAASILSNGFLSSINFRTFSDKIGTSAALVVGQLLYATGASTTASVGTSTLTASSPLTGSFTQVGSGGSLGCQTASGSQAGCLSSADWSTFNNKPPFPFTPTSLGNATGTLLQFTNGFISNSSSSVAATLSTVTASTSNLTVSLIQSCSGSNALTTNASGVVSCGGITATGGTYPFTPSTFGPTAVSATSTAINDSNGLMASSTSWLTKLRTDEASTTNLFVGTPGGAGDASVVLGTTANEWALGFLATDKSFVISSSTALGTSNALAIDKATLRLTFGLASTTVISGTNSLFTLASSTNLTVGIPSCSGSNALTTNSSGVVGCGAITAAGGTFPFTAFSWGNATSTVIDFTQGIILNASTTFAYLSSGALAVDTTGRVYAGATTTDSCTAGVSCSFSNGTESFTNSGVTSIIAGSGISVSGATGGVTVTSAPDLSYSLMGATKYYTASTSATDNLSFRFDNGFVSKASSTIQGALTLTSALTVANGGTGTTTSPISQLVYGGGNGTYQSIGTSTLSASSPLTGSFVQIGTGGSVGCQTASGSQAGCLSSTDWTTFNNKPPFPFTPDPTGFFNQAANATSTQIHFGASGISLSASSTAQFVFASSTSGSFTDTASTTRLVVSSAGGSAGCATFSANGTISNTGVPCGTGAGGSYPFTPDSYAGVAVSATSSGIYAKPASGYGFIASSTFTTFASTSQLSANSSVWFTGLTGSAGGLAIDSTGKLYSGATTTFSGTSPVSASHANGVVTISIANALSDGSTKGAASFTATDFNDSSGNISLDFTNAQASSILNKGFLPAADFRTFSDKLGTSSALVASQLLYATGASTTASVATSTLTASSPLTGSFIQIGSAGTLGCQTASGSQAGCLSSTDWTTFNNKPPFAWTPNGSGFFNQLANSTTTQIHFAASNVALSASSTAYFENIKVSTTTATSTFSNWVDFSAINVSTTTATSTFANGIQITGGGLTINKLTSCDTIDTDANGNLKCGTDATSAGGGTYPFTPATNFNQAVTATTSIMWFQNGLFASTTLIADNATTTSATTTNLFVGTAGNTGDSTVVLGPSAYQWSLGFLSSDNSFNISSSTNLGTSIAFSISKSTGDTTIKNNLIVNKNFGIGTTTPFALLSVANANAAAPLFAVASSTGSGSSMPNFEIDAVGHIITSGPKPVTNATCGTNPSLVGNDQAGQVTLGTAGPTSCTITFANAYGRAPACILTGAPPSGANTGAQYGAIFSSSTVTTFAFMASSTQSIKGTPMTSWIVSYQCQGYQ